MLRGERRIDLRRDPVRRKAPRAVKSPVREAFADARDEELFQALRARRLALAKEQGVPPYVIFHDRTLVEIARHKPRRLHEMGRISGVGQVKLDRYGAEFLAVVAAHRAD